MRFLNKYKLHEHSASSDIKLPTRVLKFKRPKWKKIQRKFKKGSKKFIWRNKRKIRVRRKFVNHLIVPVLRKFNTKRFFKTKQQTKKYISSLFEKTINFRKKNNYKDRLSSVSSYIIKPYYRIDILLWYLKFFPSSVEAKTFLNGRNVLVNDRVIGSNYELKKGDVVTLNYFNLTSEIAERNEYYYIRRKFKKSSAFFPFLEVDYYTNKIVVLKDWNELSISELALTIKLSKKLKYAF